MDSGHTYCSFRTPVLLWSSSGDSDAIPHLFDLDGPSPDPGTLLVFFRPPYCSITIWCLILPEDLVTLVWSLGQSSISPIIASRFIKTYPFFGTGLKYPPFLSLWRSSRMMFSKALAFFVSCNAVILTKAVQPIPADPLPKSFKWGVASSAYQSEGGFTNSNWDIYNANPKNGQDPYGTSVDFRHRYRSDIALAQVRSLHHH